MTTKKLFDCYTGNEKRDVTSWTSDEEDGDVNKLDNYDEDEDDEDDDDVVDGYVDN